MAKQTVLFIVLLFINSNLFAENTFSDSTFHVLDSVIVNTRLISKIKNNTPYSIERLNNSELSISYNRTTPEALMGTSGVFIQKTNHGGGAAFIRGLTGNQTLLLYDGVRVNNSTYRYGPNQYLNTIDIFTIDKIDVIKGAGSVEYGSDAMGGVVALTSKKLPYQAQKKWTGNTLFRFTGNHLEKTNRTNINYSSKEWVFEIGFTNRNFGDLKGGGNIGIQRPSGYLEKGMNAKMSAKIGINDQLTFSAQSLSQLDIPMYHKIVLENYRINRISKQLKDIHYIKWEHYSKQKFAAKLQVIQSLQYSNEDRASLKSNGINLKLENDHIRTHGTTIDLLSLPTNNWKINSGIELYSDFVQSKLIEQNIQDLAYTSKRGLYPNNSKYKNLSIFSMHKIELRNLYVETGIRYNQFNIQLDDTQIGKIHLTPSAFVQNIGISYALRKQHFMHGSIATAYRAPNIDDLGSLGIVDFRYEQPTSQLRPEKSIQYELGYSLNASKIKMEINGYFIQMRDLINRKKIADSIIQGYPVYEKQNAEKSFILGAEYSLQVQIAKSIRLHSNLAYTYGRNESKNEPMRRIPPLFGTNILQWDLGKSSFTIQHQFAGKQKKLAQGDKEDNRIGPNGTPNWNVFNLSLSHHFHRIQLQLNALNMLNEKYKTHGSGIYVIGKAFSIQINTNF